MNKLFLTAAMAALLASPLLSQAARADDNSNGNPDPLQNFYVAGNLGQTQNRNSDFGHDNSVFQNVRFGWRWNDYVGPEVGYVYLGRPKNVTDGVETNLKSRAATVGVNGKYDIGGSPWFVTGHAGYMRSTSYMGETYGDAESREKSWNNGWFAGAGVGYDVTRNVSLAVNYDNYRLQYGRPTTGQQRSNVAAFSGSLEYRF
ncbi:outer membrane beta-barrel protein [Rhodanobacter sp. DHG33]|uniref:outer membrane protein n=1 Tax=Rhodanobacter sp. DHG33 TaxID=2775921 RepID=UPI001785700C|nr:outer membrane beta-barrel protein [Rhodanobacter sp. DHG33]MBD8898588.1 porin family protein [Rhodanobacter sp. DHG33]